MVWIRGGAGAPRRARSHLLARFGSSASPEQTSDAALVVSELVTNSVVHAGVGPRQVMFLELTALVGDLLRIAVIDQGAPQAPHVLPGDAGSSSGYGLRLVDELSRAWGVVREADGTTRVWCEVPLAGAETAPVPVTSSG